MTLNVETHDRDGPLAAEHRRGIGGLTGIVSECYVSSPARSDPETRLSIPDTADIPALVGLDGDLDLGVSGKGESIAASVTSAVGETIERYCLCWPDQALVYGSYDELADRWRLPPWEYLDVHTPDQRADVLEPLARETELPWAIGTDLRSGESIPVPAELVWMRVGPLAGEPQRFPGSSSGCAAGTGTIDAVVRSLYEAIERDAFLRTWCEQRSPPSIEVPSEHPAAAHLDRVRTGTAEPHVFGYESPTGIPAVGAALVDDRDRQPVFVTGGAAALDPTAAIADALDEVAQGWPYTKYLATQHDLETIDASDATDNFDENVLYYSLPERFDEVSFLLEGPSIGVDDLTLVSDRKTEAEPRVGEGDTGTDRESRVAELRRLLSALEAIDATPIAFDLTTPDAAAMGIAVTRVVVPEMVPLTPPAILPRAHPAFDDRQVTTKPHPYP